MNYCLACSFGSAVWYYRCPSCLRTGTLVAAPAGLAETPPGAEAPAIARLDAVEPLSAASRLVSGLAPWDAALGGGQAPGSVVVLGGTPGLGKSTLALQVADGLAAQGARCLYISAEEPVERVRERADRCGLDPRGIFAVAEQLLSAVEAALVAFRPTFAVVDSIQAVYDPGYAGGPGSVSQVRRSAWRLVKLSRESLAALLLLAHVDKDGDVAGPMAVQHDVDVVAMMDGDPAAPLRLVRVLKNRFGPTTELGRFEMTEEGLR